MELVYFTSFEDKRGRGLTLDAGKRVVSSCLNKKEERKEKKSEVQLFGCVLYRSSKSLNDYDWGGKNIVI
jgi:hypothetical protein